MYGHTPLILVIFELTFCQEMSCILVNKGRFTGYTGHVLNVASLAEYSNCSLLRCAVRCAKHGECLSFNYNKFSRVCSLSQRTQSTNPQDYTADTTSTYWGEWDPDLTTLAPTTTPATTLAPTTTPITTVAPTTTASCTGNNDNKLGIEDGTIPDASITASTSDGGSPRNARLNGGNAWIAEVDGNEWIQANIGYQTYVTGFITQGYDEDWVKRFKVSTFVSNDMNNEVYVVDQSGSIMIFFGNTNSNTAVTNTFPEPVSARIVRIYCISAYDEDYALRFEILGCRVN